VAVLFRLAAAALLGWFVPASWFPWLVATGAVLAIALHVVTEPVIARLALRRYTNRARERLTLLRYASGASARSQRPTERNGSGPAFT